MLDKFYLYMYMAVYTYVYTYGCICHMYKAVERRMLNIINNVTIKYIFII